MTISNTQKEEIKKRFKRKFTSGGYVSHEDGDLYEAKEIAEWWLTELSRILEEKKEAVAEAFPEVPQGSYISNPEKTFNEIRHAVLQILSNEEK